MSKPYIVCHMMTVLDGRIDCGMTAKMPGVEEYYSTLAALNAPTSWSGRVTAQLEMAEPGQFRAENPEAVGKECVLKQASAEGYTVVADTKGTLLWPDDTGSRAPLVVVTSEQVSNEYLAYLSRRYISWIVCGKTHIDLARACEILNREFGVERMAIVGGGRINAGFLDAGLLDEVRALLDSGVAPDCQSMQGIGYKEWKPYFEGNATEQEVLEEIRKHSRQFAKRQYTWLNHQMPVEWCDMSDPAEIQRTVEQIGQWYTKTSK